MPIFAKRLSTKSATQYYFQYITPYHAQKNSLSPIYAFVFGDGVAYLQYHEPRTKPRAALAI